MNIESALISSNKRAYSKEMYAIMDIRNRLIHFLLFLLFSSPLIAQNDSIQKISPLSFNTSGQSDTIKKNLINEQKIDFLYDRKKVEKIALINAGLYGSSMAALYAAWYKNYPMGKFHSFNDLSEWQQIDKIGHLYSAYTMGRFSMEMWRHTGIERKKRILIGGLSGAAYQTVIEILDGFSSEWGWGWGDIGANILGSGLLMAQEFAWDQQKIQLKTSFHRKKYDEAILNQRSDVLFGKSSAERFLKDYNGQTYWMSAGIKSLFPSSTLPSWLQVSIGTGAEGMFGATENIGKDNNGNVTFSRPDIKRYRRWYFAPDVDLTKIKTKRKGIKTALFILNSLKFPMPSLEYSNNQFKWNWISF